MFSICRRRHRERASGRGEERNHEEESFGGHVTMVCGQAENYAEREEVFNGMLREMYNGCDLDDPHGMRAQHQVEIDKRQLDGDFV